MPSEGATLVDRDSPIYQEVARLHAVAREMRPSGLDRWNGDLYASSTPNRYGALMPNGDLELSQSLVLDHLSGSTTGHPDQAQALATVYHESLHSRVSMDDPGNPNAVRDFQSRSIDEGLTEFQTIEDFQAFSEEAGYEGLDTPEAQYSSAYEATAQVLDHSAGPDGSRTEVAKEALDMPVSMRFDALADGVVRNQLDGIVPPDPQHQRAARAEVARGLANSSWKGLSKAGPGLGDGVARASIEGSDNAVARITQHYQNSPDQPYAATAPNPAAAQATAKASGQGMSQATGQQLDGEQQRQFASPEMRAAFAGQAPAAGAVQTTPKLGNGSRDQTGPGGPTKSIGPRDPGDRGRD